MLIFVRLDYDSRRISPTVTQFDGIRDFAIHSARRKPWVKAMSTKAQLKEYEHIIRSKTHELIDELSKRNGTTVDMSYWINLYRYVHF